MKGFIYLLIDLIHPKIYISLFKSFVCLSKSLLTAGVIALVGGIFLEKKLSQKENKVLGLILPGFTFVCSLLVFVSSVVGSDISFALAILNFYFMNVPTIVFLAIYFSYRRTVEKNKSLERMVLLDF